MQPTLKVLFGPPGTGKTWLAAREAVRAVEPGVYAAWANGTLSDSELLAAHSKLVLAGRIKWVTFHSSYSYEDFVEGFRPIAGQTSGSVVYQVRKGPFREICDVAAGRPGTFGPAAGEEITAIGGSNNYQVLAADDQGWLLQVKPNRTDQVGSVQEKYVPRRIIERAAELGLEPKAFSIPGTGKVKPSDYGVDGDEEIVGSELRRKVAELLGISSSDISNSAHFGAIAKFVKEQFATPPSPLQACLVIDEINRADISRVFGELITLLEPDKRLGAKEERRVHLPYSGEERFGVPSTLSVIGTMNTADRSISSMDFAMRRRFSFIEVPPDASLCPSSYGGADVAAGLRGINRRLEVLRGRDFQIGHSPLMGGHLEQIRQSSGWSDDDTGRLKAVASVFRNRIVPLLNEYFRDDFRKIEVTLGTRGQTFGDKAGSMFSPQLLSEREQELFAEVFDIDGVSLGQASEWWDPGSEAFDASAFAKALVTMA